MAKLNVITRAGTRLSLEAEIGLSVMEIMRARGVDELLALCGGGMACATCHVYVDSASAERLAPISADESELLESVSHRTSQSRLSCQLPFSGALADMTVTIAPEE
jgi:ferredoxin, 2Fe-2S